ncbi:hypothetical protein TNCV_4673701 [Trichonephila clavipes]|nr:hypothetical protein TNCV_4673701 [Trichonephila clavipes]
MASVSVNILQLVHVTAVLGFPPVGHMDNHINRMKVLPILMNTAYISVLTGTMQDSVIGILSLTCWRGLSALTTLNQQLQAEQCNTIKSEDRNLAVNDEQAADLLGLHYQKISRVKFSVEDRNIEIRASRIVHGCSSDTHRGTSIFSRDFTMNEIEAAISDSCLNKYPGPDGIHGQMIDHLGLSGW